MEVRKEVISCRICGRKVEVFVKGREIVDVGRILKEGIIGCPHDYS